MSADPVERLAIELRQIDAEDATPHGHRVATRKRNWDGAGAWLKDEYRKQARRVLRVVAAGPDHVYLSTGCLHGEHDYCAAMTGYQGIKRPGQCKFCDAQCVCDCHSCPTCSGPVRETVGMICQTCGTDYATPASAGEPKATSKDLQSGAATETLASCANDLSGTAALDRASDCGPDRSTVEPVTEEPTDA